MEISYALRDSRPWEVRDGAPFRPVDALQQGYVAWLARGGTPEVLPAVDPPAHSLEEAKAAKHAAIQGHKVRVRDAGFRGGGVLFDSDSSARIAYLEIAFKLSSDPEYSAPWKASDGVWVVMDAALYSQVEAAGTAYVAAAFARQAELDAALDACATVEAVDSLDIESGWPGGAA